MTEQRCSRRDILAAAGMGTAGLALSPFLASLRGEDGKRPNIVFIMADDHCVQAMSCYGSRVNRTPNLDRLAQGGMRFDNCFCTNAICAPSRAVILTGKHSHINGVPTNVEEFDGSQQTFPKLLQRSGYQTAMFGKWHLKSDPTGFDYWDVLVGQGPYYNPKMIRNGEELQRTGYTTDIITDVVLDWIKNGRDQDRPFLAMCHHKAPHRNWKPSPKYLHLFDDQKIPEPETLFDDWSGRGSAAKQQEMAIAKDLNGHDLKLDQQGELNDEQRKVWDAAYDPKNEEFNEANLSGDDLVRWKYQRFAKDYLRCVQSVDDNVGRLLDYLDQSGLAENTIVVYTSDQGWYLGEHGWFDKRWMYEESLRMPLLVRWPQAIKAGSVNSDLCQNLDFAETFLDAAGVLIPDDMQGRSMLPLLKGRTPADWRESVYYQYYEYPGWHSVRRHYGVRTQRYKLMYFYKIDEWELYDLKNDPDEMKSVYDDPQYADVQAKLTAELQRLRKKYRVTGDVDRAIDKRVEEARAKKEAG